MTASWIAKGSYAGYFPAPFTFAMYSNLCLPGDGPIPMTKIIGSRDRGQMSRDPSRDRARHRYQDGDDEREEGGRDRKVTGKYEQNFALAVKYNSRTRNNDEHGPCFVKFEQLDCILSLIQDTRTSAPAHTRTHTPSLSLLLLPAETKARATCVHMCDRLGLEAQKVPSPAQ